MIRKIILGGCAAFLLSAAAQAADITEPTAYDWTGPYVGIQGGYGWGENDLSANTIGGEVVALDAAAINGDDGSFDLEGFVGGAHAGFNWQRDSLLLGLESDIEYADLDGDTVIVGQLLGRDKVAVD